MNAANHPGAHGVVRGHVVSAVKLLGEQLAEPWTLDAPAEEVYLSRSRLVRAFDTLDDQITTEPTPSYRLLLDPDVQKQALT
jgi:AraC-like DNA-binding protein